MAYIKRLALVVLALCAGLLGFQRKPLLTLGNLGMQPIFDSVDSAVGRVQSKMHFIQQLAPEWARKGGDRALLQSRMEKIAGYASAHHFAEAEQAADEVLAMLGAKDTPLPNVSKQLHLAQRESYIATAKNLNLSGIEDYIGWAAVEREKGEPNWEIYRADAAAIRNAGMSFVPYLWIQTLPAWVKFDPKYVFAGNVGTGLETEALSIFAPETLAAYDRFFGQAQREIGTYIDILRIGSPYDFGETSYPAGAAKFAFPMKNLESGFWVNEAPARAHFKAWMRSKYTAIQALNTAWGTTFPAFESLGGTLLIADIKSIHTVEGAAAFADFSHTGKGKVIEIGKDVSDLEARFPEKLDARDGVLLSSFQEGVLAFNGTSKTVVKTISTSRGNTEIALEPLQFKMYALKRDEKSK